MLQTVVKSARVDVITNFFMTLSFKRIVSIKK